MGRNDGPVGSGVGANVDSCMTRFLIVPPALTTLESEVYSAYSLLLVSVLLTS